MSAKPDSPSHCAARTRWTTRALLLLLIASVAVNVWGMVHYRLPGPLWRAIERRGEDLPAIPLHPVPATLPEPQLRFQESVKTPEAFAAWQAAGRQRLGELLGTALPETAPPVRSVERATVGEVTRETLVFTMPDGVEVPAFLLRPGHAALRAGLLVIPGHSRGIVATAGLVDDYQHANALALARAGYCVLTLEVRGFGYLARLGREPLAMDGPAYVGHCLTAGTSALAVTVSDAAAGLRYLAGRSDVAAERMGVVGFSSGGKAAILLAALDERVSVLVASGCVESHQYNFAYSRHDSYEAIPGLARWLGMSDCLGLVAPRPVLVHWGERDTSRAARCASFNESSLPEFDLAGRIYAAAGAPARLEEVVTPGLGHEFDNRAAVEFLTRYLPPVDPESVR